MNLTEQDKEDITDMIIDSRDVEEDDLEGKYINDMRKAYEKYKNDNEYLHIYYDDCLLDFLEKNGFGEIVKQFKKVRKENVFWYA